jgi:hypothetical protein
MITKEMVEESKKIELKVIDKDLYENAKAVVEIHKLATGVESKWTAIDTVRLTAYIESQKKESTS